MTIEKLDAATPDITARNVARIAELFPECVTEGPAGTTSDAGGPAIDFDLLRQALSGHLVAGPQERYRLDWPGKRQALLAANTPVDRTLRPMRADSVDFDGTRNLFIEGDNLDALKLLQETYLGRVGMIYIDPPYNTGKDFIYRDDFARTRAEYETGSGQRDAAGGRLVANPETNGRFHSDWLSMMYPRLKIARNLLSDTGHLFISLDQGEVANGRKIADEVFGEANFVGLIGWESKTKSQNTQTSYDKLQPKIEYILCYRRNTGGRFKLISKGEKAYDLEDEKGRYRLFTMEWMNASGVRGRETMTYAIDGVDLPRGKQWQIGEQTLNKFISRGDLLVKDGKPVLKMRPGDERGEITEPFWAFFSKEIGTAESAKKDLNALFGGEAHGFDTVKPSRLIERLIFHATGKSDIILDFFLGSGTTAQATLAVNAADGGRRTFVGVQLAEAFDSDHPSFEAGFGSIGEIARQRIRRAGEQILRSDRQLEGTLDTGFRAFRIDSGDFHDTRLAPAEATQGALTGMVRHIKDDRTDEDLLFGALLRFGVDITLQVARRDLLGRTIWLVGSPEDGGPGAELIACLATASDGRGGIDTKLADALAAMRPKRVLFRDDGFASDAAMENVGSRLKQRAPDTVVRVL